MVLQIGKPGNHAIRTRLRYIARMAKRTDMPEIVDSTGLTDADWAEISKLKRAWNTGGRAAFWKAMDELADKDQVQCVRVMAAYFPHEVTEAIKDEMAESGMTIADVEELLRRVLGRAGRVH